MGQITRQSADIYRANKMQLHKRQDLNERNPHLATNISTQELESYNLLAHVKK